MKRMRPPVAWDLGLALLAASPSQLRSRSEPRVPACARDGQYGAGPKRRSNRHGLQYGRQLPLQSPGQATAGRRRAISPSADRRKMTLAGATQQLYRLSWRIPFFGKLASSSTPGYAAFILHHQDSAIARRMAGASPSSIAFSKFWTSFPLLLTAAYLGVLWHLNYPWWWFVLGTPAALLLGVVVRRNRGMARASRLARTSPMAFSLERPGDAQHIGHRHAQQEGQRGR